MTADDGGAGRPAWDEPFAPQEPPWGPREPPPESPREPLLNAPWPVLLIVAAILGSYALEAWAFGVEHAAMGYGFAPSDLDRGRWFTAFTMMFVHGGWAHAIMNAVSALAFGTPVARFLGRPARGVLVFFGFFLVCGVLSALGYAAMHLHEAAPAVGASGAISGLMGAASRLLFGRGAGLTPILSGPTLSFGLSWIIVNALLAVFGFAPLMEGARIAWEAHIAGFVAGVFLIGPAARLAGKKPEVIAPM